MLPAAINPIAKPQPSTTSRRRACGLLPGAAMWGTPAYLQCFGAFRWQQRHMRTTVVALHCLLRLLASMNRLLWRRLAAAAAVGTWHGLRQATSLLALLAPILTCSLDSQTQPDMALGIHPAWQESP